MWRVSGFHVFANFEGPLAPVSMLNSVRGMQAVDGPNFSQLEWPHDGVRTNDDYAHAGHVPVVRGSETLLMRGLELC